MRHCDAQVLHKESVKLWASALRPLWMQATYHMMVSHRVAVVLGEQQLRSVVEAAERMDIRKAQVGPDRRQRAMRLNRGNQRLAWWARVGEA